MFFNNCGAKCCGWSEYPLGCFRVPPNTKVSVVKPLAHEVEHIREIQGRHRKHYNVMNLKGKRVYVMRDDLMFEGEFNDIRAKLKKQGLLR